MRLDAHLVTYSILDVSDFALYRVVLNSIIDFAEVTLGSEEKSLIASINVQLKEVFSHHVIDLAFVSFYLVLNANYLWIPVLVEKAPNVLNFSHPDLMGRMSINVRYARKILI